MTKIIYVTADGTRTEVDAKDGDSVMQTAVANDIDGIVGECGGSMMCATCHVYVDEAWAEKAGERNDGEIDLLECAASEMSETSRLSCQIKISPELEGLVVHMPEAQI
ncbi:2Fe-2S iron-sulfur cluster-binding protein [Fulvimarina sp. MAC8]|uniref:2Fe-2S iron-sulfur cluster-binding protein n=1 Tax=Fulvimarina sp. MAC8 TaxID=3162874 RepID=UPI0032EE816D